MGMTIDKTIDFFKGLECHTPQAKDARDAVIETMRRYQEIEEIVNTWRHDITAGDYHCMVEVAEVVEDGNE